MVQARTTTPINAHALKKGDVIILTATECLITHHPIHSPFDGEVSIRVEHLPTGTTSTHHLEHNETVTILVGGNSGGL